MNSTRLRAANLYRVSTKKQVDIAKDDIPMQRIACRDFATEHGWDVVIEKEEKGISGFKVSAAKRDAIQELKDEALNGEFDVLLVFMFDRLGRIENETPFILEWFTSHGIQVWSVNEGQQRMESHTDKLMNYIRFWQASGESEKTSIRVKTRLSQMTSDGIFTGGYVPFGYMLVDNGRLNKKGKPAKDIVVNHTEAEMVKMIFSKAVNEGYGTHQLAVFVTEKGFRTRKGEPFRSSNIHRILKNEICRGFLVRANSRSERIPELQIVPDAMYFKAQEYLEQRNGKNEEKRTVAMSNRGSALLSGNIFCAHCGSRLVSSRRSNKYFGSDGTFVDNKKGIYLCYHRSRKLNECDGATNYLSERIDNAVMETMRFIFSNISGCPEEETIKEAYRQSVANNKAEQSRLTISIKKDNDQLEKLRGEIAKTLTGESIYSSDDLAKALSELKEQISASEKRLAELQSEEVNKKTASENIIPAYRQFRTWAIEFEDAPFKVKKMIANQIFSRIEVGKGYTIRYEMNMTYRQFCEEWMNSNIEAVTA